MKKGNGIDSTRKNKEMKALKPVELQSRFSVTPA
jgi:hypothetical protein